MNLDQINGKSLAIVLNDEVQEGTTFYGTARWDGKTLTIDRGRDKPPFEVREEWYERIQPVKGPVARAILEGAQFWLKLPLGALPERDAGSAQPSDVKRVE